MHALSFELALYLADVDGNGIEIYRDRPRGEWPIVDGHLQMGADPIDAMRQMKNTATDPYSGGRNFSNHYSIRKWNVCPVMSVIEVQHSIAIGTALAQKRAGGRGITIVTGGDAGTAEGDFASCLVWSSRPVNPLPVLVVVTNNKWGISTPAAGQHGERNIIDAPVNQNGRVVKENTPV